MSEKIKELASIDIPQYDAEEKFTLEPNINYQGSFRISENGCIRVRPYIAGNKPSNLKKVRDGDHHTILQSKKMVRIVMSFEKCPKEELKKKYQTTVIECYKDLCEIDL